MAAIIKTKFVCFLLISSCVGLVFFTSVSDTYKKSNLGNRIAMNLKNWGINEYKKNRRFIKS